MAGNVAEWVPMFTDLLLITKQMILTTIEEINMLK